MKLNKKTILIVAVAAVLLVFGGLIWLQTLKKPPAGGLQPRTVEQEARGAFEEENKKLDENRPADGAGAKEVYNYHFAKGNNFSALGKQREAIEEFKKAEASGHPLNYSFYVSLGLAYELDGNNGEAAKAYQNAIDKAESDGSLSEESRQARIQSTRISLERVQ